MWAKSFPDAGTTWSKGPKGKASLGGLRDSREASMVGEEGAGRSSRRGREVSTVRK